MKERVAEIKDYMKNRFAGGHTKHAAKDSQHISALLNEILKTTDEMSVLVARSGIEDMSKVLTGLVEKAGAFGGRQSYASIVNTGQPKPSSSPVGEKTIIINKTKQETSTRELLHEVNTGIRKVRAEGGQVKINKVIEGKTSVIVKLPQTEDIDTLINSFKNMDNINGIAKVYPAKMLDPVVAFKGVSSSIKNEELAKSICSMTTQLRGMEDKFRYMFDMKSGSSTRGVVFRVAPSVYRILVGLGRVFTINQVINVSKKVLVRQCQRCYSFGHNTKQCESLGFQPKCHTCGQKEAGHKCTKVISCANCSQHPKYKHEDLSHPPNCDRCPIYDLQFKRTEQKTNYFGLDDQNYESTADVTMAETTNKRSLSPPEGEKGESNKR